MILVCLVSVILGSRSTHFKWLSADLPAFTEVFHSSVTVVKVTGFMMNGDFFFTKFAIKANDNDDGGSFKNGFADSSTRAATS